MEISERSMAEGYLRQLEAQHRKLVRDLTTLEAHMQDCAKVLGLKEKPDVPAN